MAKALCLLLLAAPLAGASLPHPPSGLQLDLPDAWTHEEQGDLFTASSPGETVTLFFFPTAEESAGDLVCDLTLEMGRLVQDPRVTKEPVRERVNGLEQVYLEGTGTEADGTPLDWDLTLVLGGEKSLLVLAIGRLDEDQDALDRVYRSIRRAPARLKPKAPGRAGRATPRSGS